MTETATMTEPESDPAVIVGTEIKSVCGILAMTLAVLAFLLAAMSPWAAPYFEPERKTLDDQAVDFVVSVKEKLAAKLKGEPVAEKQPAALPQTNWYPAVAVGVGAIGICLGIAGWVRGENGRMSLSAVALGSSAVLLQYFLLLAAAILFVLLVAAIFGALTGGF